MRTICYYPELVQMTGSINAALMMAQLEFWFRVMGGKPFYKFLEPCKHELYKVGDSWSEELGMTSSEIRSAFKRIGTMYKSKSAFIEAMESQDVFKGKPYAAYYDRIRKTTYYLRNDDRVREMLPQDISQACAKRDGSAQRDTTTDRDGSAQRDIANKRDGSDQRETPTKRDGSDQQDLQLAQGGIERYKESSCVTEESQPGLYREDYIIDNIENSIKQSLQESKQESKQHKANNQITIPFTEIVSLYNDILGEKLGYVRQLTHIDKKNIKNLWDHHNIQLEAFKKGFTKVAASKFLCGRVEGKNWRASLKWLLTQGHLTKVLEGTYDDFTVPLASSTKHKGLDNIKYFNQMDSHHFDFEEIERLERLYIDHKLEGQFGELRIIM